MGRFYAQDVARGFLAAGRRPGSRTDLAGIGAAHRPKGMTNVSRQPRGVHYLIAPRPRTRNAPPAPRRAGMWPKGHVVRTAKVPINCDVNSLIIPDKMGNNPASQASDAG